MSEIKNRDEHIIELVNVTKYYDDNLILENVSFYVKKANLSLFSVRRAAEKRRLCA